MARPSSKNKILELLGANRGISCSGQQLADELGVSRTAVWKSIESLRAEGYRIEGSPSRGYVLAEDTDLLSSAFIEAGLGPEAADFYKTECVDETGSTNDDVKREAAGGRPEGYCRIAARQTAGKGRRGRSFYSPNLTGVYISILLRPRMSIEDSILITTAAAVAAAKACEKVLEQCYGASKTYEEKHVDIKWVNDLFIDGKKFCGILTEAALSMESYGLDYAVLGIGFNLTSPKEGWPEEIRDVAGSLFAPEDYPVGTRNSLSAAFLNEFYEIYSKLPDVTYLDEYRVRSIAIGRTVDVLEADGSRRRAKVLGVDDRCRLIVHYEDDPKDRKCLLDSGEISIRL